MEPPEHLIHGAVSRSHCRVIGVRVRLLDQRIELGQTLACVNQSGAPVRAVALRKVNRTRDARQVTDGLAQLLGGGLRAGHLFKRIAPGVGINSFACELGQKIGVLVANVAAVVGVLVANVATLIAVRGSTSSTAAVATGRSQFFHGRKREGLPLVTLASNLGAPSSS